MKRLQNKVAIVTGGNSGIGKGIVKIFFEQGAKVVACGRNEEKLNTLKSEISPDILTIQCDVLNTNDIHHLFQKAVANFGKIDVLVANSGVGKRQHIKDVTEEDFDDIVDVNYRGLFFTVKHAIEYLNPKASIILMASVAAATSIKNHTVYSSAKAAVRKLAENMAFDLSDNLIRVNSISPGYILTPIFSEKLKADPEYLTRREKHIPLQRIGLPEDIANAALFLASDEASYITGTDLVVDGGLIASHREVD